jgi:dihydrofolate synthase/folylpolyglutamate synthase
MVAELEAMGCDRVVVSALAMSRALPSAELAAVFAGRPETAATVAAGLRRARPLAGPDGLVLVCGSLYLAGEVLEILGA